MEHIGSILKRLWREYEVEGILRPQFGVFGESEKPFQNGPEIPEVKEVRALSVETEVRRLVQMVAVHAVITEQAGEMFDEETIGRAIELVKGALLEEIHEPS